MNRFVFIVLDGVGVGALPDAATYGDEGSDTLGNVSRVMRLHLPFLRRLGLGNIVPLAHIGPVRKPQCVVGRLAPRSVGKDSTVGHWEHLGLVTPEPFPTYPVGFPDEVIRPFTREIGRQVLGNRAASGTQVIAELGAEHMASGRPIVYTSADSVFQIAAHIGVVPLDLLYSWCEAARRLLRGRHGVARVIARPFTGRPGSFARTADRKDYSLPPPGPTYLDLLEQVGLPVLGVGKISEIFSGRGVTREIKVASNRENLQVVLDLVSDRSGDGVFKEGLLMTNLVDFDTEWGHRNDVEGFALGLEEADAGLERIFAALAAGDRVLLTADHGVDPTTPSTDHSREYAPLLLYPRPRGARQAVYEGEFGDTGATVYGCLTQREPCLEGRSVFDLAPARGWRRYTPTQNRGAGVLAGVAGRVAGQEAPAAAGWLEEHLGPAPTTAVVLGSGLSLATEGASATVPYGAVPHWRTGSVSGHPHCLDVVHVAGANLAVLHGRIHEYEGFDVSEVELPVRSLAAWGVRRVILVSAAGAVDAGLSPGTLVVADRVVDLQYRDAEGRPSVLPATAPDVVGEVLEHLGGGLPVVQGVHVSLPGPQYETPAELHVLMELGARSVSMSPAAELRAAVEEGMGVAVVAVITNAGPAGHDEVLREAARARAGVTRTVEAIIASWRHAEPLRGRGYTRGHDSSGLTS